MCKFFMFYVIRFRAISREAVGTFIIRKSRQSDTCSSIPYVSSLLRSINYHYVQVHDFNEVSGVKETGESWAF